MKTSQLWGDRLPVQVKSHRTLAVRPVRSHPLILQMF
jgi:hypothetical protein